MGMQTMANRIAPEMLRNAMRQWATGVALVTVGNQAYAHGMTVNSLTSISLEPPLILVSLERSTRTHQLVKDQGRFAVAILRTDQRDISEIFAGRTPDEGDRFKDVEITLTPSGIPVPRHSLATLDCVIEETLDAGTHTVYIARVEDANVSADSPPLLYFNRNYRKLAD
jgi:flavin reductase (DIM6/NTAB) family NADH-FMN oxidoreductase RutF